MNDERRVIPSTSQEAAPLVRLHRLVREIRGGFLDQAIWLDLLVSDILDHYFCQDPTRRMLFHSEVITGRDFPFSRRIEILEKVVEVSYADFVLANSTFFDLLTKIRRFRNRLAHAHVDTRDEFLAKGHDDRIQLVFYEDGVEKTQIVTVAEMKQRLDECSKCLLLLTVLQERVKGSA